MGVINSKSSAIQKRKMRGVSVVMADMFGHLPSGLGAAWNKLKGEGTLIIRHVDTLGALLLTAGIYFQENDVLNVPAFGALTKFLQYIKDMALGDAQGNKSLIDRIFTSSMYCKNFHECRGIHNVDRLKNVIFLGSISQRLGGKLVI
ncbi:hypothetical protein OROGR_029584 [Orobanche gracilis]